MIDSIKEWMAVYFGTDKQNIENVLNNEKANLLLNSECELIETTKKIAVKDNICIDYSVQVPVNRSFFYSELKKMNSLSETMHKLSDSSFIMRLRRLVYRKIGL